MQPSDRQPASQPSPSGIANPRKKWLFRIAAAFVIPAFLLLLLEVGLRVGGFGYETNFFLKETINGKEMLVENPRFGFRFFPPGVARSPTPIAMPARKEPGTTRIFLFGESAALGDPKPAFGMGRYLERLLEDHSSGKKFEVICVAMTAINSHVVLPIARECMRREGDLWIVYMGNNEMIGPFGGATTDGGGVPSIALVRATLTLKETKTGQLIESLLRKFGNKQEAHSWRGLAQYADRKIAVDDPVRAQVDQNFRRNLEDILTAARKGGAHVIVSAVSANLSDWAPHSSVHSKTFSDSLQTQWQDLYVAAQGSALAGNHGEAVANFDRVHAVDAGFAESHFREGQCHLKLTNIAGARKEFQSALDCDAFPVRTTSARNDLVRAVAQAHPEVRAISLDESLSARCANGIPGREVFFDHVHLNFEGNYAAARALAVEVEKALGADGKNDRSWLTEERCEAALGLTDWNRYLALENMLNRLAEPLYTNQLTSAKSREDLREQMNVLRRRVKEDRSSESVYTAALQSRPDDYFLVQNYAEFLELRNKLPLAAEQWLKVTKLLPHHPIAFFQAGRIHSKTGKFAEAETELNRALQIRPDFNEAAVELGQVYRKQGKKTESVAMLRTAVQQNPENPTARFYLADALAFAGQKSEAFAELQSAIQLKPSYWEARYLLGVELALLGRLPEAEAEFREVTRLKPDFAQGHLNLGVALARQKKVSASLPAFERAVELDPSSKSAREQLETARALLRSAP